MAEILEKVKQYWSSENIALAPLPEQAELEVQLRALGVQPTREIQRVFFALNGFADHDMDSECLTFWSLQRMIDENSRYGRKGRSYVHFADFLIDSHTYAFRQTESSSAAVSCYYDDVYIVKVADSFEEFFEYYLTDIKKLFPD